MVEKNNTEEKPEAPEANRYVSILNDVSDSDLKSNRGSSYDLNDQLIEALKARVNSSKTGTIEMELKEFDALMNYTGSYTNIATHCWYVSRILKTKGLFLFSPKDSGKACIKIYILPVT